MIICNFLEWSQKYLLMMSSKVADYMIYLSYKLVLMYEMQLQ